MPYSRPWPGPPFTSGTTVRFISDTHNGVSTWVHDKHLMVERDVARLSAIKVEGFIHPGDFADHPDQDANDDPDAIAWVNRNKRSDGKNLFVMGNHDIDNSYRTPQSWSSTYGLPLRGELNLTGVAFLGVTSEDGGTYDPDNTRTGLDFGVINAATLTWLNGRLAALAPKPTFVVTHLPLGQHYEGNNAAFDFGQSLTSGYFTRPNADFRQMVTDHPHLKGFLSGHTHKAPDHARQFIKHTMGTRDAIFINAGSCGGNKSDSKPENAKDQMPSLYMTFYNNRVEVRARDHGAGQWARTTSGARVTTLTYT